MIESPDTRNPSRLTSARASCRSTTSTNFAEARACSPFSFTIFKVLRTETAAPACRPPAAPVCRCQCPAGGHAGYFPPASPP